ncbi:MAG: hypothetical protein OEL83_02975 [Desulforhopalus sp.]|nr:hypothetical protein [Desulforhopalus sp.]
MRDKQSGGSARSRRLPWWLSVLLAAGVYCGLKYGAPAIHSANPFIQQLLDAGPFFAPILAIPLLLLAAKQLYDTDPPQGGEPPAE